MESELMDELEAAKREGAKFLKPSPLLNEFEAAAFLKVSERTLQGWRQRRAGPPFIKLGRSVRYDSAALERFIRAATVETIPGPAPSTVVASKSAA